MKLTVACSLLCLDNYNIYQKRRLHTASRDRLSAVSRSLLLVSLGALLDFCHIQTCTAGSIQSKDK